MGFRENLRDQLKYADMTVKELADLSGVNKSTLASYLSTHNNVPSAEIAVKIASALGITVEYLITGVEKTDRFKPSETANLKEGRLLRDIYSGLSDRNKKMVLAIIKTVKKQDDLEKI
jgi:transcriptional regulator with XRE-family HTH domain